MEQARSDLLPHLNQGREVTAKGYQQIQSEGGGQEIAKETTATRVGVETEKKGIMG